MSLEILRDGWKESGIRAGWGTAAGVATSLTMLAVSKFLPDDFSSTAKTVIIALSGSITFIAVGSRFLQREVFQVEGKKAWEENFSYISSPEEWTRKKLYQDAPRIITWRTSFLTFLSLLSSSYYLCVENTHDRFPPEYTVLGAVVSSVFYYTFFIETPIIESLEDQAKREVKKEKNTAANVLLRMGITAGVTSSLIILAGEQLTPTNFPYPLKVAATALSCYIAFAVSVLFLEIGAKKAIKAELSTSYPADGFRNRSLILLSPLSPILGYIICNYICTNNIDGTLNRSCTYIAGVIISVVYYLHRCDLHEKAAARACADARAKESANHPFKDWGFWFRPFYVILEKYRRSAED